MLKVHSYESMGTVDGPGLRFIVFLQGCNFRCQYCANPDTIDVRGGKLVSIDEVFHMVYDMKEYFGKRGGVTFSGGEPTLQAKELIPLVERFREANIHVCIDSNGSVWNSDVERLFELVDLTLLDVKQIDNEKHMHLTGAKNSQTLRTVKWLEQNSRPFWLRYVLVPTISDSDRDIRELCETFKDYKMLKRVDILPYHRLGILKYEAMGIKYPLEKIKECGDEELKRAKEIMDNYFSLVNC